MITGQAVQVHADNLVHHLRLTIRLRVESRSEVELHAC
jgi:hypothetical protein